MNCDGCPYKDDLIFCNKEESMKKPKVPEVKIPRGYVLLHKSQLKTLGKKQKRVRTASQIRADKKRMAEIRAKIGSKGSKVINKKGDKK